MADPIIDIKGLGNYLGGQWVHRDLDLTIYPGEIVGIVGGSGSGKTTILRCILRLLKPAKGSIKVFGTDIVHCSETQANAVRRRWGMLFQQSALFSSLTLLENVMYPLRELTHLPLDVIRELALLKIALVGLPTDAANKYPSELSGGMQKRAAAARCLVLDPELLFLDEPTAGLDPKSAEAFDKLILNLRNYMGLTIVFVTHDLDSLERISDRVAFLGQGKVLAIEPFAQLTQNPNPMIMDYFSGRLIRRE